MRYTRLIVGALAFSGYALTAGAQGAKAPPKVAGQPASGMMPNYDPSAVVTVEGTLIALDTLVPMSGMPGQGLHGTLKTATATLPVHLGPLQYLSTQKMRLVKGDQVRITGSKVVMSTVPTILAASVVKGADTLKLRDSNGFPLWRGMRRGAKP